MDNKNTGLWISQEILNLEDLSIQEKFLLAKIEELEKKNGECKDTNAYFSKFLNVSKTRVSEVISSLVNKGCLSSYISKKEGTERILKVKKHGN